MNKQLQRGLAALGLSLASWASLAAPVTVNFSVTIDSVTSPLVGQSFTGSLSFDDALGSVMGDETLFDLSAFSFDFAGGNYSLGDLGVASAVYKNGQFVGLDAQGDGFSFMPAWGGAEAYFGYDFGPDGMGNGSFAAQIDPGNGVPEPTGLALAGLGLFGLAAARRRAR